MNPIGAALDVLVLVLLALALALGLKLNGRLKALRDGQDGFAKAVSELDLASRRAEAGLAEMRRAAEETHDSLLVRIETARGLVDRLEAASADAATRTPSVRFADSSPGGGATCDFTPTANVPPCAPPRAPRRRSARPPCRG